MEPAQSTPPPQAAPPAPSDISTDVPQTQPANIEAGNTETPQRRRGRELDTQTRIQILTLKDIAGWSYGQIQQQFPHIPRTTITTTCRRKHPVTLHRSGRPKTLTEDDRARLIQMVKEDPHIPYKDLLDAVDNKCSKTSISRFLRLEGINVAKLREKTKPPSRKSTGSPATMASPHDADTSQHQTTSGSPGLPRNL